MNGKWCQKIINLHHTRTVVLYTKSSGLLAQGFLFVYTLRPDSGLRHHTADQGLCRGFCILLISSGRSCMRVASAFQYSLYFVLLSVYSWSSILWTSGFRRMLPSIQQPHLCYKTTGKCRGKAAPALHQFSPSYFLSYSLPTLSSGNRQPKFWTEQGAKAAWICLFLGLRWHLCPSRNKLSSHGTT